MASAEFHHYGVPTTVKGADEVFIEGGKVYVTNPDNSEFRLEFLRFEPDSPMPEVVQTRPHAAFLVPNLEEAIAGKNVIIPPFDATDELRCAFIMEDQAVLEIMQKR
jgi:hypothetical protein